METLAELRTRLRDRANALELTEGQRIMRLLVQEILVGSDSITIRHSIPMPTSPPTRMTEFGHAMDRQSPILALLPLAFKQSRQF